MKLVFQLKHCAIGAVLLCAAMGSSALTLGRARGAALLGQPFQITVPVQLAADEDGSGLCFEADVFYGDVRQESTRVSVTPERNAAGQPTSLRIQARMPVDEPVVSVYLRSACGVSTSRRYVLLADLVSETAPPLVPNVPAPAVRPIVPAVPAERVSNASSVAVESGVVSAGATAPSVAAPASAKPAKRLSPRTDAPLPNNRASAANRPRLKLAPLDLSQDWEPSLKSSSELMAAPAEDLQKRLAAAALWKSLNLTPEEILQDAARLQGLEQSMGKLSEQTAQNQRQMQALLSRLEKSEAEKYSNPLVYALAAALLALAGSILWFWRKLRNTGDAPWWRGQGDSEVMPAERDTTAQDASVAMPPVVPAAVPAKPVAVQVQPAPVRVRKPAPLTDVDIDLHLDEISAPAPVPAPTASAPLSSRMMGLRDFSPSMSGSLRSINTQEVLDVRQQAEFFMTLGQYDDAISLLEHNIADHAEANPLVYLDLLKALHTLSRKDAYDRYRDEFNALFTGHVPAYAQFNQPGQGLDAYPELCAHIASVWPSKAALEFIEKCLVRARNAAAEMRFDLEAFRELLLLHALVTRLSGEATSGVAPFSAAKAVEPSGLLSAETGPAPVDAALPAMDIDLDLSDSVPPADNLIEFDASGLSVTPPLTPRS
ncbi:hypothetical protein [Rhodoferax sp.]|uniref:type IV pilus assembly protein FimV n=1 Tax=Rhodoferax sp. TaxID=50421 RepID=UPI002ACD6667|nr:hypothetical protein [Rhodoferax sp.]MDZ7918534.1 hypothetical protein [Rhodoferax sp.]